MSNRRFPLRGLAPQRKCDQLCGDRVDDGGGVAVDDGQRELLGGHVVEQVLEGIAGRRA
jgi:hypothetical protein